MTTPRRRRRFAALRKLIRPYRKAIGGFFGSGVAAIGSQLMQSGSLSIRDALTALGAALVAAATVYAFPRNEPAP